MSKKNCRIGVIGLGGRGNGMLDILLDVPGVVVPAVCDRIPERAARGVETAKKHGVEAVGYTDYHKMLAEVPMDGVYIATTWTTHLPIAYDCMRAGVHAGVEVGGAASFEECQRVVRAFQETGKFCMLMENCCYDRTEMAVLNMVRQGLFGEIVHLEGGYRHDLREEIVTGRERQHGRLHNFQHRNGELYPTHELGPLAKLIHINRGNRFTHLVAMASKSRGLDEWIRSRQTDTDLLGYPWGCGDVVTTLIKCAGGETITLHHDCSCPRPYSRDYCVQGTKGIFKEDPMIQWAGGGMLHFDGDEEKWESFDEKYKEKYDHPLWRLTETEEAKRGHGGMDYLILSAFAEAVRTGQPPIDTYDTVTLMAVTYLSEQSIAMGSMPVPFPDFTDGAWIEREAEPAGKYNCSELCPEYFTEDA